MIEDTLFLLALFESFFNYKKRKVTCLTICQGQGKDTPSKEDSTPGSREL
jgi:hypothetical protein